MNITVTIIMKAIEITLKINKVKTVRWQSRHTSLSVNISGTTLIIKKIKVTSVAI